VSTCVDLVASVEPADVPREAPLQSLACPMCGEHRANPEELQAHADTHKTLIASQIMCAFKRCARVFASAAELKAHRARDHGQVLRSTVCEICGLNFENESQLTLHLQLHARQKRPHACEEPGCSFSGTLSKFLDQHMKSVHRRVTPKAEQLGSFVYTCKLCGKTMHNFTKYTKHVPMHNTESPRVIKCLHIRCKKLFRRDTNDLLRHTRKLHKNIHTKKRVYKCGSCSSCFDTLTEARVHRDQVHTLHRFKCGQCGSGFNRMANYHQHLRTHEAEAREAPAAFKCCNFGCTKTFRDQAELSAHALQHDAIIRVCDVAECQFKSESLLAVRRHRIDAHAVWPHYCRVCKQGFEDAASLVRHKHRHEPAASADCDRTFLECPLCDALVQGGPQQLELHQAKHQSVQLFKCLRCEQSSFASAADLKQHVKTHWDVAEPVARPFKCDFPGCDSAFMKNITLLFHQRSVHSRDMHACHLCGKQFKHIKYLAKHMRCSIHNGQLSEPSGVVEGQHVLVCGEEPEG
jgi:KRAB domain-containing zinc finger protein